MAYQEMSDNYHDQAKRGRYEMCIREQGMIFSADARPQIRALGVGVVGSNWQDIEAIMATVCSGTNYAELDTDPGLLSAVQAAWPSVAAARYSTLPPA